jgi:predicted nuclease of predicted toxin-antitoxin system
MRFLADESCDFCVARALRDAGHDVVAVIDVARGAEDSAVIDIAIRQQRIFVTEDRDFGQLLYAAGRPACGVILLRFPSSARAGLPKAVVNLVANHGEKLRNRFVVIQPGRVRFGASLEP